MGSRALVSRRKNLGVILASATMAGSEDGPVTAKPKATTETENEGG